MQGVEQSNELGALQVDQAKRGNQFSLDLADVLKTTPRRDENGSKLYDVDAIAKGLEARGHGAQALSTAKELEQLNAGFRQTAAVKQALVQAGAQAVQRGGNDPALALAFLDSLEENGTLPAAQVGQYRQFIQQGGTDAVGKLTAALGGAPPDPKTREVKTRNPDGSETVQIVADKPGQTFASAAPAAPPVTYGQPVSALVNGRRQMVRPGSDGAYYVGGQKVAGTVEPYDKPERVPEEPLVPIMGPDGKSVLVPRSQAVGKQPANSREQGRAVTAGNAEDFADYDSAVDDLRVLRVTIAPMDPRTGKPVSGSTGTSAAIGAAMPAWSTDLFGWGTDAKKKQALIDRVKQVIGKTLEGGVLRKEDELKYEKILPTVRDTGEIVTSKLDGLEAAIVKKRGRLVDSLEDAGYDVSKFRQRGAASGGPVQVTAPNGKTYTFGDQAAADAFKRSAGIN